MEAYPAVDPEDPCDTATRGEKAGGIGAGGLWPKTSLVLKLHEGRVRAVRLDLYCGGPEGLKSLERWALGVHELAGWHAELYEDSKDLPELEGRLAALPKVTIDHLGVIRDSYPALLRLIEKSAKVKASGVSSQA